MDILSWNVLYRKYEEQYNPNSKILSRYIDENDRIMDILRVLQSKITENTVICLQECSKDLADRLEDTLEKHTIFRKHIRDNEYLITAVPLETTSPFEEVSSPTNTRCANGYLTVSNGYLDIVNCHLIPQEYSNVDVFGEIKKKAETSPRLVVAGDFNEKRPKIIYTLGNLFEIPNFGKTYKNKQIDHIIVKGLNSGRRLKVETPLLSDHHIVTLQLKTNGD